MTRSPALANFVTKAGAVADVLRKEILEGAHPAGMQLVQDEIAVRLGVSPTPIREAFGILEAEGLVSRRPHRGVVVSQASDRDVEVIYEVRKLLESIAVRQIAFTQDRALMATIGEAVREADAALRNHEAGHLRDAHMRFHLAVAEGIGSELMSEMLGKLIVRSTFFVPGIGAPRMARAHDEHKKLVSFIARGAGDAAAALMTGHLALTWQAHVDASHAATTPAEPITLRPTPKGGHPKLTSTRLRLGQKSGRGATR